MTLPRSCQCGNSRHRGDLESTTNRRDVPPTNAHLRHFEWYHLNYLANLPQRVLRGHQGEMYGVAYTPDGRALVSGGQDGTVRLWDAATGELLAVLNEHSSCVNSVDFAPEGDTFATASCDKTIKLWSLSRRKALATLAPQSQEIAACFFVDNGNQLLSVSDDTLDSTGLREVRIWDVAARSVRSDLPPPHERITSLAATRSGRTFVTFDGTRATVLAARSTITLC